MLTWSTIISRIHDEMSLPFQMLEKSDDQIIDYLKRNALKKFEMYFPQKWRITINCSDPSIQVPGRQSEYYLIDADDREIKNVTAFIPGMGSHLMTGHPIMGPWSFSELEEWSLSVYKARNLMPFSNFNYTTEFMPPNQFRISPNYSSTGVVEYERSHDPELSSINPELNDVFIDLCQGMLFMMIGRLRKKFSTTTTPFGEIPLNGDDLFNEGKDIYDRTIELMKAGSVPNVIVDIG